MKRFSVWIVAVAVALCGFATRGGSAAEELASLVKRVDAKLYYPQKDGLRSLQADVESSTLAGRLKDSPEADKVKVRFYWAAPYKEKIAITGVPDSMSDQAERFQTQMALFEQFLMPKPLALTLADYKCTVGENEKSFTIDAQATSPSARIQSAKYTIDKKTLLPTLWSISTDNFSADVEIKYDTNPAGLALPVEWKAKAGDTDVAIKLSYAKVDKWQLPETLGIAFTGGDGTQRNSKLTLSNHKANQPLPADVFGAGK